MSEKILKIAGRRRTLLALTIMATLTLSVLFSGLLTPTPSKAQNGGGGGGGGSSTNNENTNCPNYTNSYATNCPSITNNGAISPTSFCVQHGDAPPMPSLTNQPGASDGGIVTCTTETCSNITTYATNSISYSFSGLTYNPAPPTSSSAPGTYVSDCFITVTSSDTNDCPAPGNIDYGNVTWNILNTNVTTYVHLSPSALEDALDAVEDVTGEANLCKAEKISTNADVVFEIDKTPICCSNAPGTKIEVSGNLSWNLGSITCNFPYAGVPHIASINLVLTASASLDASISGETECGEGSICGSVGGNLTIGGGLGVNTGFDFVDVTLTIQCASTVTGQICCDESGNLSGSVTACSGAISLDGNISLFDGWIDTGLTLQLSSGVCLPSLNF